MSLKADNSSVYELLNDKQYIIHSNQRKYVWNRNNWQELLEDIELVYQEKRNNHFIGSIVLKKETIKDGIRNHYSVIDGQQRLCTLTILYASIGLVFVNNGSDDYFKGLFKQLFVFDDHNQKHAIVSSKLNNNITNLVTVLYDQGIESLNKGEELTIDDFFKKIRSVKVIKECFAFFYESLNRIAKDNMDILKRIKEIVDEISYIDIVAEEEEDAFNIFEILNARGQPLTDFELLRNFLLKYGANEKETVKKHLHEIEELLPDENNLELFLKHYVMHKYGLKTDKKEKRPYKVLVLKEKGGNISEFLVDLLLKAKYYNRILTFKDCSPLEYKIFSFFKPRRQQQFRPLIMGLMHQKDLGNITQSIYDNNIDFLYKYFICYHVIGEKTSNKLEDIVYSFSEKIENNISEGLLQSFRESMVNRLPSAENFKQSIKRLRFSHKYKAYSGSRKSENVRAVFEVLERENGYLGDFSKLNIEHCLPDSDGEENSEIGNLMLLEKKINDECKNKPLSEKLDLYSKSELYEPNQLVLQHAREKEFNIGKRTEQIAEDLYSYISKIES